MRLTVLGAGTLVPHADCGSPGFVVNACGDNLLFDSGSGTLYRAARAGLNWQDISHIFYTHYHPDHTLDLVSFLFAANYTPGAERSAPLYVYGPAGLEDFYNRVSAAWPPVMPKNFRLNLCELDAGEAVKGKAGWKVETAPMEHGDAGGLAYKVSDGSKSLVLSGDTQYCAALVKITRGADLLVCECSTDDSHSAPGHLSPEGVARVARESGVKRILLTHVYPPLDPTELALRCAGMCEATVEPARDLEVNEV